MDDAAGRLDAAFLRTQTILHHRILRMVRDHALAEEIVQSAYLRARTACDMYQPDNVEAFLWQTAKHLAIDRWRKTNVRSVYEVRDVGENDLNNVATEEPSPEASLIQRDLLRAFSQALLKLPTRTQKVWVLSRVDGVPYPEIARQLGISPNTVFNDIKLAMGVLLEIKARIDPP